MDINPLLGDENQILAVDARIRIEKDSPHPGLPPKGEGERKQM
jgi:hypothetical protein